MVFSQSDRYGSSQCPSGNVNVAWGALLRGMVPDTSMKRPAWPISFQNLSNTVIVNVVSLEENSSAISRAASAWR